MKRNLYTDAIARKALASLSGRDSNQVAASNEIYAISEHVAKEAFLVGARFGQSYPKADYDALRTEAESRYATPAPKYRTFTCSDKNRWQIRQGAVWVSEWNGYGQWGEFEQHMLTVEETFKDWVDLGLWDDIRGLVDLVQNPEE